MGRAALKNVKHVKSVAYFFGLSALRHMLRELRTRLKIYDYSRGQQQAGRQTYKPTDRQQTGGTDRQTEGRTCRQRDRQKDWEAKWNARNATESNVRARELGLRFIRCAYIIWYHSTNKHTYEYIYCISRVYMCFTLLQVAQVEGSKFKLRN